MRLSEGEGLEISTLPAPFVRALSRNSFENVPTSLLGIRIAISDEEWKSFGFKELRMLGTCLRNIDRLVSVEQVDCHLAH